MQPAACGVRPKSVRLIETKSGPVFSIYNLDNTYLNATYYPRSASPVCTALLLEQRGPEQYVRRWPEHWEAKGG